MSPPVVSVVTATYNRSDVLALAIRSAIAQTVTDWEMIIVGDACTDDTASTVAGFADERVHFVNREHNHGEQSVPNNEGVAMSRGRYVAFLNHDDLWFPDHLQTGIDALARTGADLVHAVRATLRPDRRVFLAGAEAIRRRRLREPVPASTWILRRELLDRVGPWRSAFELRVAPSQDWLMRVLDGGADVVGTGVLTVITVPSGNRDDSYLRTDPGDVEAALDLLDDRAAVGARVTTDPPVARGRVQRRARGAARYLLETIASGIGYHPYLARAIFNDGFRRGALIRRLRERRGLTADPTRSRHG